MVATSQKHFSILVILFIISAITFQAYAADQILFGPKELTVTRWHFHVSIHRFKADDPGDGVIAITKNTPNKKIRGGFILFNRRIIQLRKFLHGTDIKLTRDVQLRRKNRLMVFLRGDRGASITIEIRAKAPIHSPEVAFSAEPQEIKLGDSSTLKWSTTNADSVSIDQGIGSVDQNGSLSVSPQQTTAYTLTATGAGGITTESVTVTVHLPPTVAMGADPETITIGESSTLTWTSTNADSCVIEPYIGGVEGNGSISVSPNETTTYTITATGPGGTATDRMVVTVLPSTPSVSLSANPATIQSGDSSTLSWTSFNVDKAYIDNGIGNVPRNGSIIVSPEHTTTYTITATGALGSASCQIRVMVIGNPEPQPEGSFGKQYEDLIPIDATVEEYDPKRFSLITGLVHSIEGAPIEGVSITIHEHPEYGTCVTDGNGRFSIPVEGGRTMTLVYQKDGLIAAQRKVYVPWNDIAIGKTIQMMAEDPVSTTITFDGNPETIVTHQSTEVTDEFGSRACTMVFTGDNRAYLMDEEGNEIHELTAIITRATEFTTAESMPAILPPTSAYTYCVELSVDGAQRVRFEKPVITWIDNFLGFEVGEIVPVGYYNRDRGVWVPSDNGMVVKLLDTDTDGIVDALDANGDDQPDDLDGDGTYSEEIKGLNDPLRYPPEATFWRVAVNHFSPWDYNWPYGPPEDAIGPNQKGIPNIDQQGDKEKACKTYVSSFIDERGRILHEDIPIPGTKIGLHYASNRVEGYKAVITVPASGDMVPESLKSIIVKVEMAGLTLKKTLEPLPNQIVEFLWDGKDHLGRAVKGSTTAHVSVGFAYEAVYYSAPKDFEMAFEMPGIRRATGGGGSGNVGKIRARQQVIVWSLSDIPIQTGGQGIIGEGWTLSVHHHLSPMDLDMLYKGDGSINTKRASVIETVAGDGTPGYSGDGGPAAQSRLQYPHGVTFDASGDIYIADYSNNRIRKVDTKGIITTVAGNGTRGSGGDGGPAIKAQLSCPSGVSVDALGNLYIAEGNHIRRVDASGVITTVAGTGSYGYRGDGGPATEAQLNSPLRVAVDASGNTYIADYGITVFERWTPAASSPPWQATVLRAIAATGGQLYKQSSDILMMYQ